MPQIANAPIETSVIETDETQPGRANPFYLAKAWIIWIQQSLIAYVQACARTIKTFALTGQHATIAATAIPMGTLASGLYRIDVYCRVTTAAATSSSATVAIGFVEGGVSLTKTLPAIAGNTVTSYETLSFLARLDANSPITYAVTYASNPAGQMQFRLDIVVTQIGTA